MKNRQTTNNKIRMKITKTINLLLACLASACLFGSQAIAGTLSASLAPTPATIDLTAAGALDWARWGGGNYIADDPAAYNHKAGVTPLISTYTLVGPDAATSAEQWNDAGTPFFMWSDGTPTLTGDGLGNGGSYFPNTGNSLMGVGDGYQITVPASTTPQILKVFTGCYSALVNFNAALSDNSAPPYNDQSMNDQTGNSFNGVYTITFAAGSADQTLTVTITMTNVNAYDTSYANVTLEAATMAGSEPNFVTPLASSTNWVGLNQQFSVTPDGAPPFYYQWWKESGGAYVPLSDGGQISGSMSNTLTINNLVFANATNYYVVVTNVYGAVTSSVASLAIFPITGTLIGASPAAAAMVDLTALGTLDWAAWGLNVATDFDQKTGGTNQISNFTLLGPAPNGPYRYNNALAAFSWSDGTPDPTAAATTTGVYFNGIHNGYQITVPADQTKRILTVYAGGWNTTVHFEAALSDVSAPTYVDESLVTAADASRMAAYTVEYIAGSPGQALTINVYCSTDGGNVTLMAATLNGPQPLLLTQLDSNYELGRPEPTIFGKCYGLAHVKLPMVARSQRCLCPAGGRRPNLRLNDANFDDQQLGVRQRDQLLCRGHQCLRLGREQCGKFDRFATHWHHAGHSSYKHCLVNGG